MDYSLGIYGLFWYLGIDIANLFLLFIKNVQSKEVCLIRYSYSQT